MRMHADIDGMYRRLMQAWEVTTQQALAEKLGKRLSTIRNAKSEGRVPEAYITRTVAETGYLETWLRTGEGPPRGVRTGRIAEVARRMTDLSPDAQALVVSCTRLLEDYPTDPDVMRELHRTLSYLRWTKQRGEDLAQQFRDEHPED